MYQPVEPLSLFASYSRSFIPNSAQTVAGDIIEPETGEQFEVGARAELLNGRFIASLAYFDITKQNVSTPDPDFSTFAIATGEQRSQGIEVDLIGELTPVSLHRGDTFNNPAQQIPYLGHKVTTQPLNLGSAQEPSIERLTALKPDLILGETRNADEYKLLSQVAPTVLLADRTVPGQWQEHLTIIATALGHPEKVDAIIQHYQATVGQVRLDLAEVTAAHPNLLLLGGNRLEEGFYVIQTNSYLGNLLETIGFTIVSPPLPTGTPNAPVSLEALPEMNSADSIIILGFNTDLNDPTIKQSMAAGEQSIEEIAEDHQIKAIQQSWQENAIAQSLTASQENRIYFATYAKWNGLNGPTGNELVLEQLIQFFAE